jgi:nitroreductase
MDLMQAIMGRHSVRAFTSDPVDAATLDTLIGAAAAAPSSYNSQPWYFHVAKGETRRRVGEIIAQSTVYLGEYMQLIGPEKSKQLEAFFAELGGAPIVIAVSVPPVDDDHAARVNEYLSAGCAIENLLLATHAAGLGACNITFPHWVRDELVAAFGVPTERELVSLIVLGHPAEQPVAPPHRTDVATILE